MLAEAITDVVEEENIVKLVVVYSQREEVPSNRVPSFCFVLE